MKYRLASSLVLAVFCAFAASGCGCGSRGDRPIPGAETSISVSGKGERCTVILTAQPRLAKAGSIVNLTLAVTNDGKTSRTFEMPSAQAFDFTARFQGNEVWRMSSGMSFAQAVTPVTVAPGKSKVYTAAWDTGGEQPGKYRVDGIFLGLPGVKPAADITLSKDGS